jgi:hypothetical protein
VAKFSKAANIFPFRTHGNFDVSLSRSYDTCVRSWTEGPFEAKFPLIFPVNGNPPMAPKGPESTHPRNAESGVYLKRNTPDPVEDRLSGYGRSADWFWFVGDCQKASARSACSLSIQDFR